MDTPEGIEFEVGQVWSYQTRPSDEGSTAHLHLTVDGAKPGRVFYVSISNICIPHADGSTTFQTLYAPIFESALRESVISLAGHAEPEVSEQMTMWQEAFSQGEAGAFSGPLAEVADLIIEAWAEGKD
jgi:hypothetical protein